MSNISVTPPNLLFSHCKRFVILALTSILILAGATEAKGKAPTQEASGEALQAPEQETWQMQVLRLMGEDTEDGAKAAMELLQKKAESGDARARAVVSLQTYLAKDREQRESQDLEQLQSAANAGMLEAIEAYIVCNFGMPQNEDEMKQLASKAVEYKSVIGTIVQRLPSPNAWGEGVLFFGDNIYSNTINEMEEKSGLKRALKEGKKRLKKEYPSWAWASLKQGCKPMLTMVGVMLSRAPSDEHPELWGCEKEGIKYLDSAARQGSFRAIQTFLSIAESLTEYPNRLKEVIQYMKYASLADNFDPPDLDAWDEGYYEGEYVETMKSSLSSIKENCQDNAARKAADEHMKILDRITDRIFMRVDENRSEVNDDAWLRKEAENGSPAAVKMLGKQMPADPEKASEYKETMEKALNHKAWNAAYYLGRLYASGAGGADDPKKAFEYYCIGRDHAGMRASYAVVHSYLFGIGTAKNVKKARLELRTMLWNALDQCDRSSVAKTIDGGTLAKMLTAHILLGKDAKK